MSFTNKVVLITGASSGIGAAIAKLFSQEGAKVALVGRKVVKLEQVASECVDPLVLIADINDDAEAKRIIEETVNAFGKIDILVNNAGIIRYESILDENVMDVYDDVMNTNMRSLFNVTRLAASHLIESKGNIINISSVAGKRPAIADLVVYGLSKGAVDNFTKGSALEFAKHGVRVNGISPGPVKTDLMTNAGVDAPWDAFNSRMPLGKVSEAEEVAHLTLFLASEKAVGITGSDYVIDNGMLLNS